MRIDARQVARDESKRGPKAWQSERGLQGEPGPAGKPAPDRSVITTFKNNIEHYRVITYLSDGQPGPVLDLYPFFAHFLAEVAGGS